MSPDVDGIFRRFGYDPVRPVGRDDRVEDRIIEGLRKKPLVDEDTLTNALVRICPRGVPVEELDLTPREIESLRYVSRGLTYRMTAEAMGISTETAKQHLKTARFKLQAKNTTDACCEALRRGLIS